LPDGPGAAFEDVSGAELRREMHRRVGCRSGRGNPVEIEAFILEHQNPIGGHPVRTGDAIHAHERDGISTARWHLLENVAGKKTDPCAVRRKEWRIGTLRSREQNRGVAVERPDRQRRAVAVACDVREAITCGRERESGLPARHRARSLKCNGRALGEDDVQSPNFRSDVVGHQSRTQHPDQDARGRTSPHPHERAR
jgi:hypothetical protein